MIFVYIFQRYIGVVLIKGIHERSETKQLINTLFFKLIFLLQSLLSLFILSLSVFLQARPTESWVTVLVPLKEISLFREGQVGPPLLKYFLICPHRLPFNPLNRSLHLFSSIRCSLIWIHSITETSVESLVQVPGGGRSSVSSWTKGRRVGLRARPLCWDIELQIC